MSITYTLTRSLVTPQGTLSAATVVVNEAETTATIAVPDPSTNMEVDLGIRSAGLAALYLLATKSVNIFTNAPSTGVPDNTLNLMANIPRIWTSSEGANLTNPVVAATVTKIYVTLVGTGDATLEVRALYDATP